MVLSNSSLDAVSADDWDMVLSLRCSGAGDVYVIVFLQRFIENAESRVSGR
jgi:hypothetical protein